MTVEEPGRAKEILKPDRAAGFVADRPTELGHRLARSSFLFALRVALPHLGRDTTAETGVRSCVVLAPHPDDETLGCGATIARKRALGTRVRIVVATDGSGNPPSASPEKIAKARHDELLRACEVLGVRAEEVTWLGYPDGKLEDHAAELTAVLADILVAEHPDEVLAPGTNDPHADHAVLARAAALAVAQQGARLLAYPIWQWDRPSSWLSGPRSRPEVVRAGRYLAIKAAALRCHSSQIGAQVSREPDLSGPDSGSLQGGSLPKNVMRLGSARSEIFFPIAISSPGNTGGADR